jgi:hypothetical protein
LTDLFWAAALRISLRPRPPRAGSGLVAKRPGTRAWVIRIPGEFIGYGGTRELGSFQTIVVAENEEMAWDIATYCDVWERIPWKVDNVQIFPRAPLASANVGYSSRRRS